MSKRGKSANGVSTSSSAKKQKIDRESDGVELSAQWSKLSYKIVWDILRHFFTTEQAKYRRVSRMWDATLVRHLTCSKGVSLRYCDLKNWKAIFYSGERGDLTNEQKVKLVPPEACWLITDFGNAGIRSCDIPADFPRLEEQKPLKQIIRWHPQICHIVLSRAVIVRSRCSTRSETKFLEALGGWRLPVRLTILDSAVIVDDNCRPRWAAYQESVQFAQWKLVWSKVTLGPDRLPKSVTADGYSTPIYEQYEAFWPYPPEQLQWLSECLDKLPRKDHLLTYLKTESIKKEVGFNNDRTEAMLCGRVYPKSMVAFCALYLTTFRPRLKLPPPPYPLIWKS